MTRNLNAGPGSSGIGHALADHYHPDTDIVGLVNRFLPDVPEELRGYPPFETFEEGKATAPDCVGIATYSDSHSGCAYAAMEAGANVFEDGAVGSYEAGWGSMMSETAFFLKEAVSPNGAVPITEGNAVELDEIEGHTNVGAILAHRFGSDQLTDMPDELGHNEICAAEGAYLLRAIGKKVELTRQITDAAQSLAICLAAEEGIPTGQPTNLKESL